MPEELKKLKELKKLNKKELFTMTMQYYLTFFLSLFKKSNPQERKMLLEKLKEYSKIVKEENSYYDHFRKNLSKIKNKEEYNRILNYLDILNEKTYLYFEKILSDYEESMHERNLSFTLPYQDFKTLLQLTDLKEDAVALTFSFYNLMQYFSNDDATYYLVPRTKVINNEPNYHGLFIKEKDNVLEDIKLCIPQIKDKKTLEECIYLYKAGILMYKYLGKSLPTNIDFSQLASYEVDTFKKKVLQKFD